MNTKELLENCYQQVKDRLEKQPSIGLVLGSGLGGIADQIEDAQIIPYEEIEGFPYSTAPGHAGRFVIGRWAGKEIMAMQGRIHMYEGYSPQECVLPIRIMGLLGIKTIVLTNAAGAANPDYSIGDLVILRDHISTFVPSPLRGENLEELGPRFPDMTEVYSRRLREILLEEAKNLDVPHHEGIYMQFPGPNYETPAEVQMASRLGADMCGMSTAIEAMAARHMGLEVAGISLATNLAAGISDVELSEEEVIVEGEKASAYFEKLLANAIAKF